MLGRQEPIHCGWVEWERAFWSHSIPAIHFRGCGIRLPSGQGRESSLDPSHPKSLVRQAELLLNLRVTAHQLGVRLLHKAIERLTNVGH